MSLNLVQIIVERIFPQSAAQTTEVTKILFKLFVFGKWFLMRRTTYLRRLVYNNHKQISFYRQCARSQSLLKIAESQQSVEWSKMNRLYFILNYSVIKI